MGTLMGVVLAAGKGSRMKSELPKVLHTVQDEPMVLRSIRALREAGADEIVVVVGYRQDLVRDVVGPHVTYAVQEQMRGTGDAVRAALPAIQAHGGDVLVVYGDNPLLCARSLRRLHKAALQPGYGAALLTLSLENPPMAGRILRDVHGHFSGIREVQDCTPEEKAIREINIGTYCFQNAALCTGLRALEPDNSQGEYYLTDVPEHLVRQGMQVATVEAHDIFEALGVNDQHHLRFAEMAPDIRFAESVLPLVDAAITMSQTAQNAF